MAPFVIAALLCAVGLPSPALAATASVSHTPAQSGKPAVDRLVYLADPGELNDATITQSKDGTNVIEDPGATITPGEGCAAPDPHRVTCTTNAAVLGAFSLRDGDDRISVTVAPGPAGTARNIYDSIFPGVGDDRVELTAPRGRSGNLANPFVDRREFRGVFSVQADVGDDVVLGSADADVIDGGRGRDRISGRGGNDMLSGGREDDVLDGGPGDDFLLGSDLDLFEFHGTQAPDHDVLDGGTGADLLAGGPGGDLLHGEGGLDTLLYSRELSSRSQRPPAKLKVTFDGRANDGPRGEGDNVERPDVESAISVGGGAFSVAGTIALDGGAYAVAGGNSARATITTLSRAGTRDSQFATFYGNDFTVRPQPLGRATDVRLAGAGLTCATRALSPGPLGAIARKRRGLWGKGKGRFRTHGRHAAATVRGTTWFTEDRCDGTLVRVVEGEVAVRDFGRRRTVLVGAGQSYLARSS